MGREDNTMQGGAEEFDGLNKRYEEQNMRDRFGISSADVRAQVKPIFLWMYDHGISSLEIVRNDKQAHITIDGKQV
jgi:hypothetical protein